MTLRTVRLLLWGAVATTAGVLVGIAWNLPSGGQAPSATVTAADVGGEFALIDENGKPRTWSDFRGRPVAVFFGFTHCPDICPTMLGELSMLLADLGDRSDDLQVVLISGDPQRDTPQVLNAYLKSFDSRIIGLTGPETEIDRAFAGFKAYRKKVPIAGGNYTIDHSASVYLYDRDGGFAGTLDMHEDTPVRWAKVMRLLEGPSGSRAALSSDGMVTPAGMSGGTATATADAGADNR
ncbi:SCO family protein [Aureimonas sp. SK2]|uniref:SCO family protein n=1 Tax=Aureimonas sp. SK2 TaxID=3015992 RepID=UPI0024438CFC|nr:SCO family protein [Aureimonas sp. SK2]